MNNRKPLLMIETKNSFWKRLALTRWTWSSSKQFSSLESLRLHIILSVADPKVIMDNTDIVAMYTFADSTDFTIYNAIMKVMGTKITNDIMKLWTLHS